MKRELITMEVRTLLISALGLPLHPTELGEDEPLWGGSLSLGSLTALELLTALEDRFDVQFPDEMIDLSLFASVRRLVDAVTALLPEPAPTDDSAC